MGPKVAVVTGANKGIGLAIVRALCKQFTGDVILTARNESLGKASVAELENEGLHPKFHRLDLLDKASMEQLRSHLASQYGGLDVLVNNAGIAYKNSSTAPFSEQAEVSIRTNYTGTLDVCDALFPLLRPHARVVNVSSMVSVTALSRCSRDNRLRLTSPDLTVPALTGIIQEFVQAAQAGKLSEGGWPEMAYGMSKVGVTALSILQQKAFDRDAREDIVVNACCPGYVDTDMTSHKGHLTPDQGAETPVYLALLPEGVSDPRGRYVSKKQIQKWEA